jgi:glutaredoxin 3
MKVELFYFDECPFCQRVLRKISDLKLTKVKFKNVHSDRQNAEYHYKKTNRQTVPCLYIDDEPMFESLDINDWLTKNQSELK